MRTGSGSTVTVWSAILIMMSATYQQATLHPQWQKLAEHDPNNELWAYYPQRRLTAEELRDAMLLVTGELNPDLGGLPMMPEINMEVALQPRMIQFSIAPAHQPSRPPAATTPQQPTPASESFPLLPLR